MSDNWINQIVENSMPKEAARQYTLSLVVQGNISTESIKKIENLLNNNGFSVKASFIPGSALASKASVTEAVGDIIEVTSSFVQPKKLLIKTQSSMYEVSKLNITAGLVGRVVDVTPRSIIAEFGQNIPVEAKDKFDNPVVIDHMLDQIELKPGQYRKI